MKKLSPVINIVDKDDGLIASISDNNIILNNDYKIIQTHEVEDIDEENNMLYVKEHDETGLFKYEPVRANDISKTETTVDNEENINISDVKVAITNESIVSDYSDKLDGRTKMFLEFHVEGSFEDATEFKCKIEDIIKKENKYNVSGEHYPSKIETIVDDEDGCSKVIHHKDGNITFRTIEKQ